MELSKTAWNLDKKTWKDRILTNTKKTGNKSKQIHLDQSGNSGNLEIF